MYGTFVRYRWYLIHLVLRQIQQHTSISPLVKILLSTDKIKSNKLAQCQNKVQYTIRYSNMWFFILITQHYYLLSIVNWHNGQSAQFSVIGTKQFTSSFHNEVPLPTLIIMTIPQIYSGEPHNRITIINFSHSALLYLIVYNVYQGTIPDITGRYTWSELSANIIQRQNKASASSYW